MFILHHLFFRRAVTLQHPVIKVKSELDQLRLGLKLFGVLHHLEKQPLLMEPLFVVGDDSFEVTNLHKSEIVSFSFVF